MKLIVEHITDFIISTISRNGIAIFCGNTGISRNFKGIGSVLTESDIG